MLGRMSKTWAFDGEFPAASIPAIIAGGNQRCFVPGNHLTDANLTGTLAISIARAKRGLFGQNMRSETRILSPG